jgi:CHAT domain-containing protein
VEILSISELSGLALDQLQHVTLSSCWSADAFILPGRLILSLPEVFWRAGAKSILSSLWVVDDSLATAFMNRFYAYLDSMPRDEALRCAQLDCLNGSLPEQVGVQTIDPLYWAGFNLYGEQGFLNNAPERH